MPLLIACQDAPSVERLSTLVVDLAPALVLTQTPLDRDPEHHAVAAMVWRVFNQAAARLGNAVLRFWECGSSCEEGLIAVPPDHTEDISDYYETKLELCACHYSQMGESRWARVKERAPRWGAAIGVRYAEPFWTANMPWRSGPGSDRDRQSAPGSASSD
jgi:LmbE family N-acetylglucosaminyl deacetylase